MKALKRCALLLVVLALLLAEVPEALAAQSPSTYSTAPTSSVWWTYNPSLHYFYNQLTTLEKRAFSARYDALALGKPELWNVSNFGLSNHQWYRVYYAMEIDCPELLFHNTLVPKFNDASELRAHSALIKSYLPQVIRVLKRIQNRKDYKGSAFNHQYALDRYIVSNVKYRLDSVKIDKHRRCAYSVFLNSEAVCEGYARGVQLALRYFGIPCLYVSGTANKDSHAWNLVQLGGSWYHYDPTWNDADDKKRINDFLPYFNMTDSLVSRSHTWDKYMQTKYGFTLPTCSSTAMDYYKVKGQYVGSNWKKQITSLVNKAKKAKKKSIGIRMSSPAYYNAALKTLKRNGYNIRFRYTYWYYDDALFFYFTWK